MPAFAADELQCGKYFLFLIAFRKMLLDKTSRRILRELQRDGRITVQELAERVGLSASPCWRRVKELEKSHVIRRYTVEVDRQRVGLAACMWLHISIARHTEGAVEAFEKAMLARPEVVELYETTGDADYLVKVLVPDIPAYDSFLRDFVFKLPGLAQVRTHVSLRELKCEMALPL